MEDNVWVAIFTNPAVVAGIVGILTTVLAWLGVKLRAWLEARLGKERLQSALMMAEVKPPVLSRWQTNLDGTAKPSLNRQQRG